MDSLEESTSTERTPWALVPLKTREIREGLSPVLVNLFGAIVMQALCTSSSPGTCYAPASW